MVQCAVSGEDVDFDFDAGGERAGRGEDEVVPVAVGQRTGEAGDGVVVGRPEVDPPERGGGDELALGFEQLTLDSAPSIVLSTCLAEPDSPTAERLQLLAAWTTTAMSNGRDALR